METPPALIADFQKSLDDCRELYRGSGELIVQQYPELAWKEPASFLQLMESLHAGLLVKTYFTIALADQKWSRRERILAALLISHIWQEKLEGGPLQNAAHELSQQSVHLKWYGLVRPFAEVAPLRERSSQVETIVTRIANLVARIDGEFTRPEQNMLHSIQHELQRHLRRLSLDGDDVMASGIRLSTLQQESHQVRQVCQLDEHAAPDSSAALVPAEDIDDLPALLAQLQGLVGLRRVKQEITTLSNLIRLSQQRSLRGLPKTEVSLHMVFAGNPGTGKTTVARLVARILRAMGVLKKGHLVETDRSGLVAQYAGQTGPKTNQRIDEALDGVLFIDEAYSLVAQGEDAFGREALQVLLKRMEDDRDRLVVILAGYPQPMNDLLSRESGLAVPLQSISRFRGLRHGGAGADLRQTVRGSSFRANRPGAGPSVGGLRLAVPAPRQTLWQRAGGAKCVRERGAALGQPHCRRAANFA